MGGRDAFRPPALFCSRHSLCTDFSLTAKYSFKDPARRTRAGPQLERSKHASSQIYMDNSELQTDVTSKLMHRHGTGLFVLVWKAIVPFIWEHVYDGEQHAESEENACPLGTTITKCRLARGETNFFRTFIVLLHILFPRLLPARNCRPDSEISLP